MILDRALSLRGWLDLFRPAAPWRCAVKTAMPATLASVATPFFERLCAGVAIPLNLVLLYSATLPAFASCHERQALELVYVLLVLDQRAVQRRDELLRIALAQRLH